jgi:hypothetical protein
MPRDDDDKSGGRDDELEEKLARIGHENKDVSALERVAAESKEGGDDISALEALAQGKAPRGSDSEDKYDTHEIGKEEDKEEEIPDGEVATGWEDIWGGQQAYAFPKATKTPDRLRIARKVKNTPTELGWQLQLHDLNIKLHNLETSEAIKLFRAFVLIHQSWAQIVAKAFFRLRHTTVRVAPSKKDGDKKKSGEKAGGEGNQSDEKAGGESEPPGERNVDDEMQRKMGDEANADTADREDLIKRREAALKRLAEHTQDKVPSKRMDASSGKVQDLAGPLMDTINDNERQRRRRDCDRRKEQHIRRLLEINESSGKPIREVPHNNNHAKWAETLLHINESGERGDTRACLHATAGQRGDRDHIRELLAINDTGDDIRYMGGGLKATCQWARVDNSLLVDPLAREEDSQRTSAAQQRGNPFSSYR